jgi:hypothetical protein
MDMVCFSLRLFPKETPVLYLAWHRMRYETVLFEGRFLLGIIYDP